MSRLLVDDVTKTDARALLNVNKMATISDIVAPSNEYIYASGANELTVVEGCVIAVGGAGIFKTANTILTAADLDAGSAAARWTAIYSRLMAAVLFLALAGKVQ